MSKTAAADFLRRIDEDAVVRTAFLTAVPTKLPSNALIVEFARQWGFEFTESEFHEIAAGARGELSDDELGAVAGGTMLPGTSVDARGPQPTGSYSIGGTTYEIDRSNATVLFGGRS